MMTISSIYGFSVEPRKVLPDPKSQFLGAYLCPEARKALLEKGAPHRSQRDQA